MVAFTNDHSTTPVDAGVLPALPIVAGHFEVDLQRPLGAGGMAIVYLGRDTRNRRTVALKTLRLEYRNDPASRARFRREIRTMAFLVHPNVPTVYDLWEDDNAAWAVIEYVPGRSLKEIVQQDGPLSLDAIVTIFNQLAGAVSHLHAQGLVHLDLKPQNLLISDDGTLKLIDFGLTQPVGRPQDLVGGLTFGTAAYLAPEQACGDPVDAATDIYALGCIAYELLTGRPPFEPATAEEGHGSLIEAHLHETPMPPSQLAPWRNLPAAIDDVVLWALSKRPSHRFASAIGFAESFEAAAAGVASEDLQPDRLVAIRAEPNREFFPGLADDVVTSSSKRRWRHASRWLWRACLLLLVANFLLGVAIYAERGSLPGILSGGHSPEPGGIAVVTTDGLNLRTGPGMDSATMLELQSGQELRIGGEPIIDAGEAWWPVVITYENQHLSGYVWDGGIEGRNDTLIGTVQRELEDLVDKIGNLP